MNFFFNALLMMFILIGVMQANQTSLQIKSLMNHSNAPNHPQSVSTDFKHLQEDYVLVIFFRPDCPHCHKFIPILKDFANYYHMKIEAYSTDTRDPFQLNAKPMNADLYRQYFLNGGFKAIVPALFLKNRDTDQVYPVLFGEAEPYQLASRMAELFKHIKEHNHA